MNPSKSRPTSGKNISKNIVKKRNTNKKKKKKERKSSKTKSSKQKQPKLKNKVGGTPKKSQPKGAPKSSKQVRKEEKFSEVCPYGSTCKIVLNNDVHHIRHYDHSKNSKEKKEENFSLKVCPYGSTCIIALNNDFDHITNYDHSKPDVARMNDASKATRITSGNTTLLTVSLTVQDIKYGAFSLNESKINKVTGWLIHSRNVHPHINQPKTETIFPLFDGSVDDFLLFSKNKIELPKQMKNKTTNTNNVFTGFLYGIAKGSFPFTISMRYQDEECMVFDDIRPFTPLHLLTIPTTKYIPDWRYLLKKPKEGSSLLNKLFSNCWEVARSQFLSDKKWCSHYFGVDNKVLVVEKYEPYIICGVKYPTTHSQLHLHFMMPPFFPYCYNLWLNEKIFIKGRFIPFQYIQAVLRKCIEEPYPKKITADSPQQEIFDYFDTKGINYDADHLRHYQDYGNSHRELANWNQHDFAGVALRENEKDKVWDMSGKPAQEVDNLEQLVVDDNLVLRNYGQPYIDDKPTTTYYKYPKQKPIEDF